MLVAVGCICLGLLMLGHTCLGQENYCPGTSDAGSTKLSFREDRPPSDIGFACPGGMAELVCCMQGFTRIEWQRFDKRSGKWQDFLYIQRTYHETGYWLAEDNQTAVIKSVEGQSGQGDETEYICRGFGQKPGESIEMKMRLQIRDGCYSATRPPTPLAPVSNETQFKRLRGTNVTLPCRGFFWQDRTCMVCDIYWLKINVSGSYEQFRNINTSSRVYTTSWITPGNIRQNNLVIKKIQESDYGTYYCLMTNRHSTTMTVHLREGDPDAKEIDTSWMVVAIAIGCLAGFSLLMLAVLWQWKDDIELFYKLRVRKHRFREGSRVLMLYDEQDDSVHEFAERLRSRLLEQNYPVYHPESIPPNEPVLSSLGLAADSSSCLIMVLSDNVLANHDCSLVLRENLGSIPIIIVVYQDIRRSKLDIQLDNTDQRHDGRTLQTALKVATRITWPGDSETDAASRKHRRKVEKFWKKLRIKVINYVGVAPGEEDTSPEVNTPEVGIKHAGEEIERESLLGQPT